MMIGLRAAATVKSAVVKALVVGNFTTAKQSTLASIDFDY